MVLLNKIYYTPTTITISNKTTIYGNGKMITDQNVPIFDIKANDIVIDGIRFEGNGRGTVTNYATTRPLQIGINIEGVVDVTVYKNIRVSNVYLYNLGGAGVKVKSNKDTNYSGGMLLSNIVSESCYIGYFLDERGEYNSFSNFRALACEYGAYITGGNNSFSNPNFEMNRTGMYFTTGINPAHSTIIGGNINHSLSKGLDINGLTTGQQFNGVQILNNDIYVTSSDGAQFLNCDISAINIVVATSTNTNFKNCKFQTTPTVFTGMDLCTFSNTDWIATVPTGFKDTNEQSLYVNKKLNIFTGLSGATADITNQSIGSVEFANGSGGSPIPFIIGKSNANTALTILGATDNANTNGDIIVNIRKNDNTDFTTLTTSGFKISRFGTVLLDMLRNGNTTFTGNITAANLTSGSYTPTLTNITNTSSLSGQVSYYTNLSNIITLTVRFSLTETSANTSTSFRVTLPVNRTSSTAKTAIGSGVILDNGTSGEKPIRASFDTANNSTFLVNYRTTGVTGATSGTVTIQYSTAE